MSLEGKTEEECEEAGCCWVADDAQCNFFTRELSHETLDQCKIKKKHVKGQCGGQLTLNVADAVAEDEGGRRLSISDAQSFAASADAQLAVRTSIAEMAGVSPSQVTVELEAVGSTVLVDFVVMLSDDDAETPEELAVVLQGISDAYLTSVCLDHLSDQGVELAVQLEVQSIAAKKDDSFVPADDDSAGDSDDSDAIADDAQGHVVTATMAMLLASAAF